MGDRDADIVVSTDGKIRNAQDLQDQLKKIVEIDIPDEVMVWLPMHWPTIAGMSKESFVEFVNTWLFKKNQSQFKSLIDLLHPAIVRNPNATSSAARNPAVPAPNIKGVEKLVPKLDEIKDVRVWSQACTNLFVASGIVDDSHKVAVVMGHAIHVR